MLTAIVVCLLVMKAGCAFNIENVAHSSHGSLKTLLGQMKLRYCLMMLCTVKDRHV